MSKKRSASERMLARIRALKLTREELLLLEQEIRARIAGLEDEAGLPRTEYPGAGQVKWEEHDPCPEATDKFLEEDEKE